MQSSNDCSFGGKKGKLENGEYPFKSAVTTVTNNNNEVVKIPKDKYSFTIFPLFLGVLSVIKSPLIVYRGHAVAQWLRHCTTNRKVAGSITDGVI
jgi:hypothetical protein